MPVDFSGLVLQPSMDAFARPMTVTPVKSNPMAAPYAGRGIWTVDNINVMGEFEAPLSTRVLKFGVRLSEFAIAPTKGDMLTIAVSDLPMGYLLDELGNSTTVDFVIDNDQPDGQGGTTYILKRRPGLT